MNRGAQFVARILLARYHIVQPCHYSNLRHKSRFTGYSALLVSFMISSILTDSTVCMLDKLVAQARAGAAVYCRLVCFTPPANRIHHKIILHTQWRLLDLPCLHAPGGRFPPAKPFLIFFKFLTERITFGYKYFSECEPYAPRAFFFIHACSQQPWAPRACPCLTESPGPAARCG